MTTTVQYHADGYGPARPAINVKLHCAGRDMRSADVDAAMPENTDAIHELAYERVVSDFWQAAEELADQYGLGAIEQTGRSGGWLEIVNDPTHGGEDAPSAYWLRAYRALSGWAGAYIADAPGRISQLAQDFAMDELGARAVNQIRKVA